MNISQKLAALLCVKTGKRIIFFHFCCFIFCYFFFSVVSAMAMDDEAKHLLISGACGAGSETILHYSTEMGAIPRVTLATVIGSLPGLVKEINDSRQEGNEFSAGDMTADVLGSFAGALVGNMVNDRIEIRLKAGRKSAAIGFVLRF